MENSKERKAEYAELQQLKRKIQDESKIPQHLEYLLCVERENDEKIKALRAETRVVRAAYFAEIARVRTAKKNAEHQFYSYEDFGYED